MYVKTLLNNNFNNILKATQIACPNEVLHNIKRLKYCPEGKQTYEGKLNCGIITYITSFLLTLNNIEHKAWLTKFSYGKYIEDHVHIRTDTGIIIDPTYRQFFTDSISDGNCNYFKFLFEDLDPFFVGTSDEFEKMKHQILFNRNLHYLDNIDIYDFWQQHTDITHKMNLYQLWQKEKKHYALPKIDTNKIVEPFLISQNA